MDTRGALGQSWRVTAVRFARQGPTAGDATGYVYGLVFEVALRKERWILPAVVVPLVDTVFLSHSIPGFTASTAVRHFANQNVPRRHRTRGVAIGCAF